MQQVTMQMEQISITSDEPANYVNVFNESLYSFSKMRNRLDLSDITLTCENRNIHAHKCVLAACSPYFQELFQKEKNKKISANFEDIKYDDLETVVKYVYEGKVTINPKNVRTFQKILKFLKLPIPADITNNSIINQKDSLPHDLREPSQYDKWIKNVNSVIQDLSAANLREKVNELIKLNIFTDERLIAIVHLILEHLLRFPYKISTKVYAEFCQYLIDAKVDVTFQNELLLKSNLIWSINVLEHDRKPLLLENPINSLDKQVHSIQQMKYELSFKRCERLTLFWGYLESSQTLQVKSDALMVVKTNLFKSMLKYDFNKIESIEEESVAQAINFEHLHIIEEDLSWIKNNIPQQPLDFVHYLARDAKESETEMKSATKLIERKSQQKHAAAGKTITQRTNSKVKSQVINKSADKNIDGNNQAPKETSTSNDLATSNHCVVNVKSRSRRSRGSRGKSNPKLSSGNNSLVSSFANINRNNTTEEINGPSANRRSRGSRGKSIAKLSSGNNSLVSSSENINRNNTTENINEPSANWRSRGSREKSNTKLSSRNISLPPNKGFPKINRNNTIEACAKVNESSASNRPPLNNVAIDISRVKSTTENSSNNSTTKFPRIVTLNLAEAVIKDSNPGKENKEIENGNVTAKRKRRRRQR